MSAHAVIAQSSEPSWLTIDVVGDEDHPWPEEDPLSRAIEEAADALARHPALAAMGPAMACLALSSDAAVKRLNATYRGQDKPTNVLSFPVAAGMSDGAGPRQLGDIVLARETVVREAQEREIPLADHVRHLAIHGLLHLIGYDHETEAEAARMEGLEAEILASLGIQNPYGDHGSA